MALERYRQRKPPAFHVRLLLVGLPGERQDEHPAAHQPLFHRGEHALETLRKRAVGPPLVLGRIQAAEKGHVHGLADGLEQVKQSDFSAVERGERGRHAGFRHEQAFQQAA